MSIHQLSRRALLSGLGAGLITMPTLVSSRRSFAAPTQAPKRLVIMQGTNGVLNDWWPTSAGTPLTLSPTLAPLQKYQDRTLVVGGLKLQAGMDTQNNGVGHHSLPYLLTGARGAQGGNSEGPIGVGNGISIDQFVAKTTSCPIPSLELGAIEVDTDLSARSISYNGPANGSQPDDRPPEIDPRKLFSRLNGFSGMASGAGLATLTAQKKSVLDAVAKDLTAISNKLSKTDQTRLATHTDAVRALEMELGNIKPSSCSFTDPGGQIAIDAHDNLDALLKMQLSILASAFACDVTRVATVMMMSCANDEITFPWLGSEFPDQAMYLDGNEHHGIAHGAGDGSGDKGPQKRKIDTWYMSLVAWFCDLLASMTDVDGSSILDNTLVVWTNHMGNGAAHNIDQIPFVLVGGQWYFKTGRYVTFNPVAHNGLLVAIANAMGAPTTTFGNPDYGGELSGLRM